MKISAVTECGPHREANEDAVNYGYFDTGDCYALVCDGMGGVSGGQLASSLCIEKTSNTIEKGYRKRLTVKGAKNLLESAIGASNAVIHNKANEGQGLRGMGTTIVGAIILGDIAVIAHVGDSRAYLINDNVTQITKDHSLVQAMLDNGKITLEEAKTHPDRNIITRAVGVVSFVDVEFDIIDLKKNDKLLLCSDGLSGALTEEEIINTLAQTDFSVDALVKKAIDNGSNDNVTALLIQGE